MGYIPKRVRFDEFPVTGFLGITCREALDMAMDGEIPAYYHIPVGFELEGESRRNYGDFHGPLAQLPIGKLEYLHAHGHMAFDQKNPFQALRFYGNTFGPPQEEAATRLAFDLENYFWLFLGEGKSLEIALPNVIFIREDIERAARQKTLPQNEDLHPSERRSAAQIIAALAAIARLDLSSPYAAEKDLRVDAARRGLELPNSPETVVKFLKSAAEHGTNSHTQ